MLLADGYQISQGGISMKFTCGTVLAIALLASSAVLAQDTSPSDEAFEASSELVSEVSFEPASEAEEGTGGNGWAITGGCVGGAVLGSVVPGLGNLVGCAAGGLISWFISDD